MALPFAARRSALASVPTFMSADGAFKVRCRKYFRKPFMAGMRGREVRNLLIPCEEASAREGGDSRASRDTGTARIEVQRLTLL